MPITQWCWRCGKEVPMLDESEWEAVAPLLGPMTRLRPEPSVFTYMALARYTEITGEKETDLAMLLHHRAALYGPPCENCAKPLRSPQASFCAACGERVRR